MTDTSNSKVRIFARSVGRRKTAIASVRLIAGSGKIFVNGQPIEKYFPSAAAKLIYTKPFSVAEAAKYDATVKVSGGGHEGQLDAMVMGLARALSLVKKDFHSSMRLAGLLTRDSRERQRRMVGTGGKARRQKQSPKR